MRQHIVVSHIIKEISNSTHISQCSTDYWDNRHKVHNIPEDDITHYHYYSYKQNQVVKLYLRFVFQWLDTVVHILLQSLITGNVRIFNSC